MVMVTVSRLGFHYRRGPAVLQTAVPQTAVLRTAVLADISFAVEAGEIVGVIGPNGCGKSTLLKIMAGLLTPSAGEVSCGGRRFNDLSVAERARLIAYLPQEYDFPFPFRVLDVVLMGRAPYQSSFGFDSVADIRLAEEALHQVGGAPLMMRNVQELSGGEKQRILIARALVQKSPLLVLDEPTSHLDLGHSRQLLTFLQRWVRESGGSVVMASHDITLVTLIADRILLLAEGGLQCSGPPALVIRTELIERVYGTKLRVLHDADTGRPYVLPL